MKNLVHRLEKRGWKRHEIVNAVRIIKEAKQKKVHAFLHERMYWILLLVLVVFNFSISLSLIPILMVLRGFWLYFIIVFVGFFFGLMFELLVRTIEHLKQKHHLWLSILVPTIAIVSGFSIANFSNGIDFKIGIKNFNNPLVVGLIYAFSFTVPYIWYRFVLKKEYYS